MFLDNDLFWLHSAASGLSTLKRVFGDIPNVIYLGSAACDVQRIHDALPSANSNSPLPAKSAINTAIVFDRVLDLVTPMMTQITYEGMLDETFGISCGMIEFPEEVTKKKSATKLLLTNEDPVYKEVRNRHFTNVFGYDGVLLFGGLKCPNMDAAFVKQSDGLVRLIQYSMSRRFDPRNQVSDSLSYRHVLQRN